MSTLNVTNLVVPGTATISATTLNATTLQSNTINHTNGTNALLIDSAGRVTRPNVPAFYGWRDSGSESWESYTTAFSTYVYNVASVNRGNCYSTSTGIFTVPVAGIYAVNCGSLCGQGGSGGTLYVFVNGVNRTARGVHNNAQNVSLWFYCSHTFLVSCAVNDQISIRITTFANGAGGSANVYGREHAHLSIWLYG